MKVKDIKKFINILNAENDRGLILVASQKIDNELKRILEDTLIKTKKETLLDNRGPIGTFSSRIALVHRLGLIDDDFKNRIDKIREMRNLCAHQIEVSPMSERSFTDKIGHLTKKSQEQKFFDGLRGHYLERQKKGDPKVEFIVFTVAILKRLGEITPKRFKCGIPLINPKKK